MKFKALMLSLSLSLSFCIPAMAGDELDGEHVAAQESLPAGMADRIMIRKNPKNADEIVAYQVPKSVACAINELEGLKDDAARNARTAELVRQIETPANAIENPKKVIKELDQKKAMALLEKNRELNGELSTPAWGWRRWARAAYWGAAYFSPYVYWGGYYASYYPYYAGWGWGWGGYAYGFYGNGWGWC